MLVCETYRWHGHMEGESVTYRSDAEIAEWKQRCPISTSRKSLQKRRWLSSKDADGMQSEATARVDAALKFAQQSPDPALDELTDDVYAPEPEYLYARPASSTSPAPAVASQTGERHITCAEAIREALGEEMARDPRVYLLGEDVARGGYFAVTTELVERFGEERVVDTPISEYAIVGSAVGAAMTESRPVAEILFSDFLTTCMDPIVNNAAKLRYMSGGQYRIPLVVRTPGGGGLGMAAQHSQSFEALLAGIPGLIVIAPATPADAKGLLKAAIRSNNPVLFFENKLGYTATGAVPNGEYVTPIGVADVKREGRDVTVVPIGGALNATLAAAERLAESSDGIEAEVIDPRTLVPLDIATIVRSVAKTGRLVTVEEAPEMMGFGAEIVAKVTQHAFHSLRSAPVRIAATAVPIPDNIQLERAAIPDIDRIERSVRAALA